MLHKKTGIVEASAVSFYIVRQINVKKVPSGDVICQIFNLGQVYIATTSLKRYMPN